MIAVCVSYHVCCTVSRRTSTVGIGWGSQDDDMSKDMHVVSSGWMSVVVATGFWPGWLSKWAWRRDNVEVSSRWRSSAVMDNLSRRLESCRISSKCWSFIVRSSCSSENIMLSSFEMAISAKWSASSSCYIVCTSVDKTFTWINWRSLLSLHHWWWRYPDEIDV